MNYKIDEGNVRFPSIMKMNEKIIRIYFDQNEIEKEDIEGKNITIHTAKYIDVESNPKSAITGIKEAAVNEIKEYDNSSAVNEFTINGMSMWLNSETRDKLAKRLDIDEKSGLSETKLIYNGIIFELPITIAETMLLQLELYARDCFDKTNEHISKIYTLNTVEEVAEYDYTTGYPEKLNFLI